jgi:predicted enzyme related to lactoylglutathione lyase
MSDQTATIDTANNVGPATVSGVAFVSSYVDDFPTCYRFYSEVLGLEKEFDMGTAACFFKLGADSGLYLQGGGAPAPVTEKSIRATFTLKVASASALYEKLRAADVRFVQGEPMDMGSNNYWFQFHDPAGNILEVLGGK